MDNSAQDQQQQRQAQQAPQRPQNSVGNRRWQRDNQRQQNYVLDKDWRANKDWNSQVQIEQDLSARPPQSNPGRQQRNRKRAQAWKKNTAQDAATNLPAKPPLDVSQYASTVNTAARDEPLYDVVAGSRPTRKIYSHNLDFSGFPLLCDVTYREMKQINPRLKREMPFCAFLHAMTSCLNAWLFRTVTEVNCEDRYSDERDALSLIPLEMMIPQPISEYLGMINTIVTPSGDTIKVNIPDDALPSHSMEHLPPGSFGPVAAGNHNAYECYVSPYITRRFLEASRDDVAEYAPLPAGTFPEGTKPTRNLLGYFPTEKLTPEGRSVLTMYEFPESDDMAGRLQIVPALLQEVSNVLIRCMRDYSIVKFHDTTRKPVQTGLVYALTTQVEGNANVTELSRTVSNVHGPYAFGNSTASQAVLFSLKRERTNNARGLCYVKQNNSSPDGWNATINENFHMGGIFRPMTGIDGPQFRADSHQAFPPDGLRENFLADWLKRFKIKRQ